MVANMLMTNLALDVPARQQQTLNFDQKNLRMSIAKKLLNNVNDYRDLLKRVLTGAKSWVYGYDIESLYGCGNDMVRGRISFKAFKTLLFMDGIMNEYSYLDLLKDNFKESAEKK